ncbi:MAG: hypothetical protein JNK31_03920 [Candidatus Competibacter sp.]|nr:hypothetical protein [Candidatus Competibacter sp.]
MAETARPGCDGSRGKRDAEHRQKSLWSLAGVFKDDDTVAAPPFAAAPFGLAVLWG